MSDDDRIDAEIFSPKNDPKPWTLRSTDVLSSYAPPAKARKATAGTLTTKVTPEEAEQFRSLAKARGGSASGLLAHLIRHALSQRIWGE